MLGKLRPECILQSKFQQSQRFEDWPSSARRIIAWHENSRRLFVTLFATDKCSYSHLGEKRLHTPFQRKAYVAISCKSRVVIKTVVQGQTGSPPLRSWVEWWERYLVIWNSNVASEHPDAEYKYRGVFVAFIDHQAWRGDLNNISTLNTFMAYLYSLNSLVSLDLFSKPPKRTGVVYSLVFRILLPQ